MDERAAKALANRERMPETAALVDSWRAVFGAGVAVRYASEGGLEVGQRGPAGVPLSDWSPPRADVERR